MLAERFAGSGGIVRWTNYLITTLTRYFHDDHLGSIAVITNEMAVVVEQLGHTEAAGTWAETKKKAEVRTVLRACVEWFNAKDREFGGVIETEEREDISALLEELAFLARQRWGWGGSRPEGGAMVHLCELGRKTRPPGGCEEPGVPTGGSLLSPA